MPILVLVRTVLWSFLGIRRGASARADGARLHPLALLATALVLAAVFVLTLLLLARAAVGTLAA